MRSINACKCPVCGVLGVNESDELLDICERLDICRQEWNYCPVCGRFIRNEATITETVYNRYTDTAGNYHWTGVHSGEHIVRMDSGEREKRW